MTEKIRRQIMAVRDTGRTNMLDTNAVQRILELHPAAFWISLCLYNKFFKKSFV